MVPVAVQQTLDELGGLDILVNNAAEQHPQDSIEDITAEQLEHQARDAHRHDRLSLRFSVDT